MFLMVSGTHSPFSISESLSSSCGLEVEVLEAVKVWQRSWNRELALCCKDWTFMDKEFAIENIVMSFMLSSAPLIDN